jgi:hypothetical protein
MTDRIDQQYSADHCEQYNWRVPPYESPIEQMFGDRLKPLIAPDTVVIGQQPVQTICGRFVLDFAIVCTRHDLVIGVECDGAEFHDPFRDRWRDAMIFATGKVSMIYRFTGSQIHSRRKDAVHDVIRGNPEICTIRTLHQIGVNPFRREYPDGVRFGVCEHGRGIFGLDKYRYAKQTGITRLDDLIAHWMQNTPEGRQRLREQKQREVELENAKSSSWFFE